jgi:hypothetical protein
LVTIYEKQGCPLQVGDALAARLGDGSVGIDLDEVEFFEAIPF